MVAWVVCAAAAVNRLLLRDVAAAQAIKMYRMALDQTTSRELRVRIQRNIGLAHVRMGQFAEAIEALEQVMEMAPGEARWDEGGGNAV